MSAAARFQVGDTVVPLRPLRGWDDPFLGRVVDVGAGTPCAVLDVVALAASNPKEWQYQVRPLDGDVGYWALERWMETPMLYAGGVI